MNISAKVKKGGKRPGSGRPRVEKQKPTVSLRLSDEALAILLRAAEAHAGGNKSAIVEQLLQILDAAGFEELQKIFLNPLDTPD